MSGISVRFGGIQALDSVGLAVPAAGVVGLVGPNGAGKSTLFGVVSGLVRPDHGRVLLAGWDVTRENPQRRATLGVGRTFQHPHLFDSMTVRGHLILGYRLHHERRRLWRDLLLPTSAWRSSAAERDVVESLLDTLHLGDYADTEVGALPLGISRLVEVGQAVATAPRILLLDEPSAGLDRYETARLAEAVQTIVDDRNLAVLLVEHDLEMVMSLSQTLYVLEFGRIIASGPPAEVRADPAVQRAYLGMAATGESP